MYIEKLSKYNKRLMYMSIKYLKKKKYVERFINFQMGKDHSFTILNDILKAKKKKVWER